MLAAALVMVFLVLLTLTIAAPTIAKEIQRDREVEAKHRADQYVRAIRVYYRKLGHYPGSVDQLEKTNNQRFLRQKYLDPMTGKDDWRLIHVGENKTKVKGFFGEDLPGLTAGLGSASGLQSSTGTQTTGTQTTGGSIVGTSSFGTPTPGTGTGAGGTGTGSGPASSSVDDLKGSGGPFMGVGSSKTGEAMLTVNEQTNYQDWEFLYDPNIEQMYAKGNLLGGAASGGLGTGTGLPPTPTGTTTPTSDPNAQQPKQ